MANTRAGKPDLLYILKILWEHDDSNPISKTDIIKELQSYGVILGAAQSGVLGYKTLNRNLQILQSAGKELGFEIVDDKNKGVYLNKTQSGFDDGELIFLINEVVNSSNFSSDAALDIIDRIKNLGTTDFKNKASVNVSSITENKTNYTFFTVLETLNKAIANKKQVKLTATTYWVDGALDNTLAEEIVVNPIQVVKTRMGKTVLLCVKEGTDKQTAYQIEKILGVEELDTDNSVNAKDIESVLAQNPFSLGTDNGEPGGHIVTAKICVNVDYLDEVIDTFGAVDIEKSKKYATKYLNALDVSFRINENDLVKWAMFQSGVVEIIQPFSARRKVLELTKNLKEKYLKNSQDKYVEAIRSVEDTHALHLVKILSNGQKLHEKPKRLVERLELIETDITDLAFLTGYKYKDLQFLTLDTLAVKNIPSLAKELYWHVVKLAYLPITNFDFLKGSSIERLELKGLPDITDWSGLYEVRNLRYLRCTLDIVEKIDEDKLRQTNPALHIEMDTDDEVSNTPTIEEIFEDYPIGRLNNYPLNLLYQIYPKGNKPELDNLSSGDIKAIRWILDTVINTYLNTEEKRFVDDFYKSERSITTIAKDYTMHPYAVFHLWQELNHKLCNTNVRQTFDKYYFKNNETRIEGGNKYGGYYRRRKGYQ